MPRVSVVVPIYNVEPYLAECLASIAAQSFRDLEVIIVDDGSTDGSAAIAERFAAADGRFRIVTQPNGGLGNARNNGAAVAGGEFLAFVDSDDVLPPYAYKLLLESLDATGSDFATGNVHRLTKTGTAQSPFLAAAFAQTRPKTHVTEYRPLIADRIVPNKLWRRSFWDAGGYRFPEGMLHEDIPVVVPAHFDARSVDVFSEPVYLYRIRDGDDLSITQRRLEQRALLDRMTGIEQVTRHLGASGPRGAKRWYQESVVADDLRYYLNVLDSADADYRELFLERVNAYLDGAGKRIYHELPAIERLKWELVRRRLIPELLEVLRFQKDDLARTPPVEMKGRWYGDYPFRTDGRLGIPRSVYRVDDELVLHTQVEELRRDGDRLHVEGFTYVGGIGAPAPGTQRVTVKALRPGRLRRIRLVVSGIRLKTVAVERPDVTAKTRQQLADLSWSGFRATIEPRTLRRRKGTWELYVGVRAAKLRRRRSRFLPNTARPIRVAELPPNGSVAVRVAPTAGGGVSVEARRDWLALRAVRLAGADVLELTAATSGAAAGARKLELARRGDGHAFSYPIEAEGDALTMRIALADLRAARPPKAKDGDDEPDRTMWDLFALAGATRVPVGLPESGERVHTVVDGLEFALTRTRRGDAAIVQRIPRPVVDQVGWSVAGELELAGELRGFEAPELLLVARQHAESHRLSLTADAASGRFSASIAPTRIRSLAGALPLREGSWDLRARRAGADDDAPTLPVLVDQALLPRLPLETVERHKQFALAATASDRATLLVQRDLDDDERGSYHQRRLRETVYATRRCEPLRDAVVFASFGGRQFSDSPRAIHQELVRRGTPLEQLWVVRDGMCEVPDSATVLREGSREHHEALARARYVVSNDHFPDWFLRRPDQTCLQTWHGTPLKRLGLDVSDTRKVIRRFQRRWDQQVANWQYVVSPNRFSTPILQRAYAIEGEMLETGYPRSDVLVRSDLDAATRSMRRKLDVPEDARVVLYAPTYRDHVLDRNGRYRLDLHLDLDRLRAAVGPDTIVLFRKHHYVADAVPTGPDGFVRDVSSYPDGTELLLAADVLVTDYSSIMFDFANLGRPMLFFTYDLDAYKDEIRGFYVDYVDTVPGPLLRTTDELADALGNIDAVRAGYAERYAEFTSTFCSLDDGRAAARVVDRVFES